MEAKLFREAPGLHQDPAVLAERAQLPCLDEVHQLAESAQELWQAMEPLATFTDADVLGDNPPSNWQMITPSKPTEPEAAL